MKFIFLKFHSYWFKNYYRTFQLFTLCFNLYTFDNCKELNLEIVLLNFEIALRFRQDKKNADLA